MISRTLPAKGMTARGHRALLKTIALYERRPGAHDFYSWFSDKLNARTGCGCPLAWIGHYARLKGSDAERMDAAVRLIGFDDAMDFYASGEGGKVPADSWALTDYKKALRLLKRLAKMKVVA